MPINTGAAEIHSSISYDEVPLPPDRFVEIMSKQFEQFMRVDPNHTLLVVIRKVIDILSSTKKFSDIQAELYNLIYSTVELKNHQKFSLWLKDRYQKFSSWLTQEVARENAIVSKPKTQLMSVNEFQQHIEGDVTFKNDTNLENVVFVLAKLYRDRYVTIYDRTSSLDELIQACDKFLKANFSKAISKSTGELGIDNNVIHVMLLLKEQAIEITRCIFNAKSTADVLTKLDERRRHLPQDRHYMPWTKLEDGVELLEKNQHGADVDMDNLIRYSNYELERHRLLIADGRFIRLNLNGSQENQKMVINNFIGGGDNFVIRQDFSLFVADGDNTIGKFHSSFAEENSKERSDDKPIFFAGRLRCHKTAEHSPAFYNTNGALEFFSGFSGHYRPDDVHLKQTTAFFRKAGLIQPDSNITCKSFSILHALIGMVGYVSVLSDEDVRNPQERLLADIMQEINRRATLANGWDDLTLALKVLFNKLRDAELGSVVTAQQVINNWKSEKPDYLIDAEANQNVKNYGTLILRDKRQALFFGDTYLKDFIKKLEKNYGECSLGEQRALLPSLVA